MPKTKNKILFLSVPESLRGQVENASGDHETDFSIDPNIPIPAEIPGGDEQINMEELSWEMILSGMLRVISAGEVKPEWIDYYRHFVLILRPAIMGEFTEAAILKARNGDFDLALEILESLGGLFPASPVVKLNRALVMEERAAVMERRGLPSAEEAFRETEAAYEQALAAAPDFPAAYFNAGFFRLGRKDFRRARELLLQYLETADDPEKMKKARGIIKDIDKSGLEDEDFHEAYTLINQGKEEAGMEKIRAFIEKRPSVWNGWFVLGWALRRLGRWEDGAAAFGQAIELGAGGSDTRNELAICLMETGDLSGARRELETALREDPENVKIISNLGVLALKNGKQEEAAAFFRSALDLDPGDPVAAAYSYSPVM